MRIEFTIGLIPRTKKNSSRIINAGGRMMVIPSRAYKQYERDCKCYMPKIDMISCPVNVKAIYYMPTKRRVDLVNLHEALHDILVKYGILEDDNSTIIVSTDGSRVKHDKLNPRTQVTIETVEG